MERKKSMPLWAHWGLWGLNSRESAVFLRNFSVVFAVVAVLSGVVSGQYYLFIVMATTAWFWASIKWADRNAAWSNPQP